MKQALTLEQYIMRNQREENSGKFTSVITDIGLACRMTAALLRYGNLKASGENTEAVNASGDQQAPLDIQANNIFLNLFENNDNIAAIVSEELEDIHFYKRSKPAKYFLVIDPLDGSGNLDINAPVATIFSLCKMPNLASESLTQTDILNSAMKPVAAGICNYGLEISMAITTGNGVQGFVQNLESGAFFLSQSNIEIKPIAKEVAINFSNRNFWNPAVLRYIDECFQGEQGPRKRYFNTRWYASAAAELNRILHRGGIFIYPACSNGKPEGVLRKLYEAWPMAMLVEAAGGKATNGSKRILDITANHLHERTPFAMGSVEEIELLAKYHQEV
jgi:fructose-1,6-bisphosphatase